jgi:Protein of unknown function (DUF2786)
MGFDKLDVVRKLLAKAERAATPEEAASYTDKALRLSARHGIDAALLDAERLAAHDPAADQPAAQRIAMDDPYSAGKARLLAWTATALRCRVVFHQARGGRVGAVTVFGFAADRARVELLYTSLLLQAGTQLVRLRPAHRGESVAAYRRSWLHGFALRVHGRLVEVEQAAADEPGESPRDAAGTALVLADRRDRVATAFAATFPTLGRARARTLSGSGFADGTMAGDRADLGGVRLAETARPAVRA